MHTIFWLGNVKRRDKSEDLDVDGRIILKLILQNQNVRMWTGKGPVAVYFECSNFIKRRGNY
jgi:hypothetical protein